jgi:hypothetical protein
MHRDWVEREENEHDRMAGCGHEGRVQLIRDAAMHEAQCARVIVEYMPD